VFTAFGRAPADAAAAPDGELQAVRRTDVATSIDELEIGLTAMAAAVRGARGEVIAALSISGPTLRMTPARIEELNPILTSEARTLSRRLGHRDQGERAA
jgi:DNA-binding IclR family transcriptional regulator